jgi:salicylate hydroxylase
VPTLRIAIVGGGIGGLVLALALRERGVEAEVYEQASALREVGAAVALSANLYTDLAWIHGYDAAAAAAGLSYRRTRQAVAQPTCSASTSR